MRLTASDLYTYHLPSRCELRPYLKANAVEPSPPGPFEEVLRTLGKRHERQHLESFADVVNLSSGTLEERTERTIEEVGRSAPAIYQAVLRAETVLNGVTIEILGEPDFLLRGSDGYVIRDCKIARRITEADHPEIRRQLELYGWLYENTFGKPPIRLEVFSGTGELEPIPYDGGTAALAELGIVHALTGSSEEPFSPVGWSKCQPCGYSKRCWPAAEQRHDVAVIYGVDQGLVRELRDQGVSSYDKLISTFDEKTLAALKRPWGSGTQKVGKRAGGILTMARAMERGGAILLQPPDIPEVPNYVMFDLEGMPPHLDEVDKIYLWGTQVFGDKPSEYHAALSNFGEDGDREGWESFLGKAARIFSEYGALPFVHWHHYEKSKINLYIDRYGDPDGVAGTVLDNLLDLLPETQRSIALPVSSYSLKVIEKYVGFKRTQDEFGGEWSMAKYIEATETEDEALRSEVMDSIVTYTREDLAATWAVLEWLKSHV